MRKLMNPRIAALVMFSGTAAALLAANYTPTRAALWGTAWAVLAVAVVRHELRRDGAPTGR
ncbi:hypothetical protein O4215_20780 [Rhodococcus maanshanensis]|uniref:hypothetical protein n=1 Tax=Rhodococcus maanshanensis TaxID=183556 RepID=UPI0022B53492|nr:hypothetical protein [Rhodococcus maanshanensis]MCZ4558001.1 hypothetical protein [Rhodococcus maanshanensis]